MGYIIYAMIFVMFKFYHATFSQKPLLLSVTKTKKRLLKFRNRFSLYSFKIKTTELS